MGDLLCDDKYYEQCTENAAERYNKIYNIDSIIEKFVELYKKVTMFNLDSYKNHNSEYCQEEAFEREKEDTNNTILRDFSIKQIFHMGII